MYLESSLSDIDWIFRCKNTWNSKFYFAVFFLFLSIYHILFILDYKTQKLYTRAFKSMNYHLFGLFNTEIWGWWDQIWKQYEKLVLWGGMMEINAQVELEYLLSIWNAAWIPMVKKGAGADKWAKTKCQEEQF